MTHAILSCRIDQLDQSHQTQVFLQEEAIKVYFPFPGPPSPVSPFFSSRYLLSFPVHSTVSSVLQSGSLSLNTAKGSGGALCISSPGPVQSIAI